MIIFPVAAPASNAESVEVLTIIVDVIATKTSIIAVTIRATLKKLFVFIFIRFSLSKILFFLGKFFAQYYFIRSIL